MFQLYTFVGKSHAKKPQGIGVKRPFFFRNNMADYDNLVQRELFPLEAGGTQENITSAI